MPTYEYVCKECGEHLEAVQAFSDPPLTTCAACGGQLRKVFGNVGIVFKGSGFYKTDSRASANGSKGPVAGASSAADGGEKSDGGSGGTKEAGGTKEPASTTPSPSSSSPSAPSPSSSSAPAASTATS